MEAIDIVELVLIVSTLTIAIISLLLTLKTKYRYEIIARIKNDNYEDIIQKIYNFSDEVKNKNVIVFVETNPQNLS